MDKHRQLSMRERIEIDISSMKNAIQQGIIKPKTSRQCWTCEKYLEEGSTYCEEYAYGTLPEYVMFPKKECEKFVPDKEISFDGCDEKLYGGIIGHCIGDVLGVPVEFSSRGERCTDPVKEMRAYGTYSQPFGTWSDDTALSLCLIDAIGKGGDYKTIADNFIAYMDKAEFTPGDEMFDIGRTTQLSIEKMKKGVNPIECGMNSEDSNGNGSLMRILPLVFFKDNYSDEQMREYIKNISSLTHGHVRSIIACEFYVEFAYRLIKGSSKEDSYNEAVRYIAELYENQKPEELGVYKRLLDKTLINCSSDEIRSTGYVVDSLEASIWAFFKGDSYEEVVLTAINLGGDTDTIGAIAGGLAGIFYGLSNIPRRWVQSVRKLEFIKEEIEQFEKALK